MDIGMSAEAMRETLAELEGKLAEATAKATELQTERRRLSFDANTGDEAARKKLDKLNAASATVDLEIENLKSALDEAKRRLAEAERAEARNRQAAGAAEALKIAERRLERGRRLDEAFAAIRADLDADKADIDELHRCGVTHPRGEQFKVFGSLAVATHLMGLPFRIERTFLAPSERQTFTELARGSYEQIRRVASALLDKGEAA